MAESKTAAEPKPLHDALQKLRDAVPKPNASVVVMGQPLSFFTEVDDLRRLVILSAHEAQTLQKRLSEARVLADVLRDKIGLQ